MLRIDFIIISIIKKKINIEVMTCWNKSRKLEITNVRSWKYVYVMLGVNFFLVCVRRKSSYHQNLICWKKTERAWVASIKEKKGKGKD